LIIESLEIEKVRMSMNLHRFIDITHSFSILF
jgi:hypothetical protein